MPIKPIEVPQRPAGLRYDVPGTAGGSFDVQALASVGVISIFDAIGPDTNARRISAALREIGPLPVTVEINSPGGDVFEGIAIYNLLRAHGQPVTVQILGLAASAASVVAMAGDRVEIAKNAQIMIHNARAGAYGDTRDMLEVAGILARVDKQLQQTYADRTRLRLPEIVELMNDETFLSADEAVELGFADALLRRDAVPAPKFSNEAAPTSKLGLEARLRAAGLSKSICERLVAAGWPALNREQSQLDLQAIAACVSTQAAQLQAALQTKGA